MGELLGEVTRDLSTLMRQEVALAKAEAKESATQAGKGAGMLAGAGVAGHFVLLFLSLALMWALGTLFDSLGWAAVVVAVLWGIVAAVLALRGKKELARTKGVPRTQETAKKIPNALTGHEEKNA
nr:phage holin family protein [Cellulomonas marina]